ncbi:MAG: NPCBM/NEW2 domain-containing protein [Tepidisphaeraceae bacterium]
MRKFLPTVLLVSLASVATADTCQLLNTTLTPREATVVALDDTTVTLSDNAKLPTTDLVELRWSTNNAKPKSGYMLLLADGQRLSGRPEGMQGESLRWMGAAGPSTVDLKQVRAILPASAPRSNFEPSTDDVVKLKNGDAMHGLLNGADNKAIQFRPAGATDDVRVEWGNVASLQLAGDAPKPPALDAGPIFRVTLTDGSVLHTKSLSLAKAQWSFADTAGVARTLNANTVASVERLGGKVCWLSTLTPDEVVDRPFFPTANVRQAMVDHAATREPIGVSGQSIDRALGVHSYSKLHYRLPGDFKQLRFRYAIPDELRAGNVTVRAYIGDKVAYEKADVTAGTLSEIVTLDLAGAKSIALEVDYGKNYDVQDDLNWIDAAVTR